MGYLIKNGTVVYANGSYTADVLVEGEKITQVAKTIDAPGMTSSMRPGNIYFPDSSIPIHISIWMREIFIPQMILYRNKSCDSRRNHIDP